MLSAEFTETAAMPDREMARAPARMGRGASLQAVVHKLFDLLPYPTVGLGLRLKPFVESCGSMSAEILLILVGSFVGITLGILILIGVIPLFSEPKKKVRNASSRHSSGGA
jgi:hypothetical protein